jgi:outer membrane protein assembly factor BamB/tetratricopeptide (TPR) repeat protein
MNINGKIEDKLFADIFQKCLEENFAGTMRFELGMGDKVFFFSPETVTFKTRGEHRSPLIGQILMAMESLSYGFIESALEEQENSGDLIGEILVRFGIVTSEAVQEALQRKLEIEFFELFQCTTGDYEVTSGSLPDEFKQTLKLTTIEINSHTLFASLQKAAFEWQTVTAAFDPAADPVIIIVENLDAMNNLHLPPEVLNDTTYINGQRTILDIAAVSRLRRFDFVHLFATLFSEHIISASGIHHEEELHKHDTEAVYTIDLDNGGSETLLETARDLARQGKTDKAFNMLKDSAETHLQQGNLRAAAQELRGCLEINPCDVDTIRELLEITEKTGGPEAAESLAAELIGPLKAAPDIKGARNACHEILDRFPDNLDIRLEYAAFLRLDGEESAAVGEFEAVREVAGREDRPDIVEKASEGIALAGPPRKTAKTKKKKAPKPGKPRPEKTARKLDPKLIAGIAMIILAAAGYAAYTSFFGRAPDKPASRPVSGKHVPPKAAKVSKKKDIQKEMYQKAVDLENKGDYSAAMKAYRKFVRAYPFSDQAKALTVPIKISTRPAGCRVEINSMDAGATGSEPVVFRYSPKSKINLSIRRKGFESFKGTFDGWEFHEIEKSLDRVPIWSAETQLCVDVPLLYSSGILYGSCRSGELVAVSAGNGSIRWKVKVGEFAGVLSPPAIHSNIVFVGNSQGRIAAISVSGKKLRAAYRTTGAVHGRVGLSDKFVAAASTDGRLTVFKRRGGSLVREHAPGRRLAGGVIIKDSKAYFGSTDNHLYVANLADGSLTGLFEADDDLLASPVIEDGVVYVASISGNVSAIDAASGKMTWTFSTQGSVSARVATAADKIYFATEDGVVHALNKATGAEAWVWKDKPRGDILAGCVLSGQVLYVADMAGVLYALDAGTGKPLWSYSAGAPIAATVALGSGKVYIATTAGKWCAIVDGKE